MKNKRIYPLAECAVMLALAVVLSFVRFKLMGQGGSITVCSMLPLFLLSIRHGWKWSVGTAFCFSLFQLYQGLDNLAYCATPLAVVGCILLDYLLPYTLLGFAGILRKKGFWGNLAGMTLVSLLRLVCHIASGVVIWGEWAGEVFGLDLSQSVLLYSLIYNAAYLIPDLLICLLAAVILFRLPATKSLLEKKF